MTSAQLFAIRTAVAAATRTASLSGFAFTVHEAQRITNPELFIY